MKIRYVLMKGRKDTMNALIKVLLIMMGIKRKTDQLSKEL